jgi:hypothetical protein
VAPVSLGANVLGVEYILEVLVCVERPVKHVDEVWLLKSRLILLARGVSRFLKFLWGLFDTVRMGSRFLRCFFGGRLSGKASVRFASWHGVTPALLCGH